MNTKLHLLTVVALLTAATIPAHAEQTNRSGKSDFSLEIGNRVWIGQMSHDNSLITNATGTLDSRLRWTEVNTMSNETSIRITHDRSGVFLKAYGGFGANYGGSLDDEDYAYNVTADDLELDQATIDLLPPDAFPFSGKYLDSYLKGDKDSGFYGAFDIGAPLPLPEAWPVKLSGFVGGFAQKQGMLSKGVRCNADDAFNAICGDVGTVRVPFDTKSIGYETTMYGARAGLETVIGLSSTVSWRSEDAYLFAGHFKLEDSHYLRTAELGPTPNIVFEGNKLTGLQLETELSWAVTEKLSLNAGARYWRFKSGKTDTLFGAKLPEDDQDSGKQHTTNTTEQYGAMVGLSYKF